VREERDVQSNFDKRDSLKQEKAKSWRFSVRSDSFHRHNVQRFSGVIL
jgi:hypothetical protein